MPVPNTHPGGLGGRDVRHDERLRVPPRAAGGAVVRCVSHAHDFGKWMRSLLYGGCGVRLAARGPHVFFSGLVLNVLFSILRFLYSTSRSEATILMPCYHALTKLCLLLRAKLVASALVVLTPCVTLTLFTVTRR